MAEKLSDLHRAKRGVAILITCVVQTLNEKDRTFQKRFLKRLSEANYEVRNKWVGSDITQELELLQWTRAMLTGV